MAAGEDAGADAGAEADGTTVSVASGVSFVPLPLSLLLQPAPTSRTAKVVPGSLALKDTASEQP